MRVSLIHQISVNKDMWWKMLILTRGTTTSLVRNRGAALVARRRQLPAFSIKRGHSTRNLHFFHWYPGDLVAGHALCLVL